MKNIFLLIGILVVVFTGCQSEATPTPEPTATYAPGKVPGIDYPLIVYGMEVLAVEVAYLDEAPAAASSRTLCVTLTIQNIMLTAEVNMLRRTTYLTDENLVIYDVGDIETEDPDISRLYFTVPESASSFVLHFWDGAVIDLTPMMEEREDVQP